MLHRIITTISIHIVAHQIPIGIHIHIRIQEPSPLGIIVSGLQIVKPRLGVIIIPTVTERIHRVRRITTGSNLRVCDTYLL